MEYKKSVLGIVRALPVAYVKDGLHLSSIEGGWLCEHEDLPTLFIEDGNYKWREWYNYECD